MKIRLHKYFSFLLLLILANSFSFAQENSHRMTEAEKTAMPDYLRTISTNHATGITTPPTSPVRASAEWEEIDYLMVAWTTYPTIIREIVRAARLETQVIIICGSACTSSTDSTSIKNTLTSNGIPLTNIHFLYAPCNSIWSRDYGQWNIYTNDVDSLALIDWIYNRPRPKDDTVPLAIANFTGLPIYRTTVAPNNLVHTGGDFMTDGFGTGFSSNLILTDNSPSGGFGVNHTSAEIDTIMKNFMGINRYVKMTTLPYDVIHHIDMHLKLLDEETLLVGEYPAGVADGPQIEANLQYVLSNYNSVFGTPYKIIRVPMPPGPTGTYPDNNGDYRTYANATFVNKTIILPTYAQQYDTTALRIWRDALPGYTIKTIDCNSIIPQLGAIHCITKEVAAADPLLISHQALHDTYNAINPYQVDARIQHRSGIASAEIYYRTDTTQPYISVSMTQDVDPIYWTGFIPAKPAGTSVYYYIQASSVSGKTQVRPMPAPAGYWKFNVLSSVGIAEAASTILQLQPAFPNPSKGITCIPVSCAQPQHANILLKDILGRTVQSIFEGEIPSGEKKYFVNTENFASGVYMIELKTKDKTFVQKLIVR